jgi:hypothetical protein
MAAALFIKFRPTHSFRLLWIRVTAADPGAPFAVDTLQRLAALKTEDRAAFEALRAQLKRAGVRVTALDEAIAAESGDTSGRSPTQADQLIELSAAVDLFHAPDGTAFADIDINGHRETWPIRSKIPALAGLPFL